MHKGEMKNEWQEEEIRQFLLESAGEELIPESQSNKKKDLMALFTLVGFSIMMILDVALG